MSDSALSGDRPVIGISAYSQQARWGSWDLPAVLLPRRYTDMVTAGGGQPVLLPPSPGISSVLGRLDGLLLSGGGDIDPDRYGAPRDPATDPANPGRDDAEIDLARRAIAAGLPLLGICRGLQVVNVALGGTLHQHLPAVVGHDGHSPEQQGYGSHKVSVAAGSQLAGILGRTEAAVPTHHHQAVDRLGDGLIPTAWTDDGTVEAAEMTEPASFMIAVQWHPEAGDDLSLFTALAAAAERYRDLR
ncbi:MAG TPA: gamma-glutamyl-gamma-aminobutyrate hydrolase family protein [Streptosporangiaceae bacterium]|nr:gamma-glutamyl-gamma-aminobutyrate hydrolase family protein [Streptosporangiaceae bacterium]